ncbi:hypothetical protein OS493_032660 [Desmophyllum pertusum]|uniref:G-protein coupled receptors family 1 profile domain-containing protein n=1 Tax=Desmophyllum pertusum TaxID=174260 RepID=A0A9W9Y8H9_9CNID|nr:hypothetical protein OS493_032660 [Desmophyllum pertusum]
MVVSIALSDNTTLSSSLHYKKQTGHGTISAQDIKTSRLLFATVLVFFVCWTPFPVMLILEFAFKSSISSSKQSIYPLFSSTSSWINPVIYGVMNRAMRKEFRDILFCRKQYRTVPIPRLYFNQFKLFLSFFNSFFIAIFCNQKKKICSRQRWAALKTLN